MGKVFPEQRGLEDGFDLIIPYLPRAFTQSICVGWKAAFLSREKHYLPMGTSVLQQSVEQFQKACKLAYRTVESHWLIPTILPCKNMHWVFYIIYKFIPECYIRLSSCLLWARKTILSRRHYTLISCLSGGTRFCINSVSNWQQHCCVQYLWQETVKTGSTSKLMKHLMVLSVNHRQEGCLLFDLKGHKTNKQTNTKKTFKDVLYVNYL